MQRCPSCGIESPDTAYCQSCGAAVAPLAADDDDALSLMLGLVCAQCESYNDPGVETCTVCAAALSSPTPPAPQVAPEASAAAPPADASAPQAAPLAPLPAGSTAEPSAPAWMLAPSGAPIATAQAMPAVDLATIHPQTVGLAPPAPSAPAAVAEIASACTGCGATLDASDRFCAQCGTRVVAKAPPATPAAPLTPVPPAPEAAPRPADAVETRPSPVAPPPPRSTIVDPVLPNPVAGTLESVNAPPQASMSGTPAPAPREAPSLAGLVGRAPLPSPDLSAVGGGSSSAGARRADGRAPPAAAPPPSAQATQMIQAVHLQQEAQASATQFFGAARVERFARLILVKGHTSSGSQWRLQAQQTLIGRSEGLVLFPDDRFLSRRHCRLEMRGAELWVVPEPSTNGVLLRLRGPVSLQPGDEFVVGAQRFRVLAPEARPAVLPATDGHTPLLASMARPEPPIVLQRVSRASSLHEMFVRPQRLLSIGRSLCDLNFGDDPYISNRHAQVARTETGLTLEDCGSRNGVFLRLVQARRLQHGDTLMMGEQVLRVELGT